MSKKQRRNRRQQTPIRYLCEAEVAPGLEFIAAGEIQQNIRGLTAQPQYKDGKGWVQFSYQGELKALCALKTVIAINVILRFDVPRPKALLGHQHFAQITRMIHSVRSMWPAGTFKTLSIGAAGKQTRVMQRLQRELGESCNLAIAERGDLHLRVRPSQKTGWETLIRISPRPLATRDYRIHNMEGALNASVAHAMCLLTSPQANDVFVNIACGSGTLLIERAMCGELRQAIGIDNRWEALQMAQAHAEASGHGQKIKLIWGDAHHIPLASNSVEVLAADLPFGQLVGDMASNETLYPAVLKEGGRIAQDGARFIIITHAIRLMEKVLRENRNWAVERILPITLSGLHPRIFLLKRKSRTIDGV